MIKSDKQQLLEALNGGRDWQDIFRDALDNNRGQRGLVNRVAAELGISHQTVYDWAEKLGIDLNDYRN